MTISCSKAITVLLINRSDTTIIIDQHGKQMACRAEQMVSFIPEEQDGHEITVRLGAESLFYHFKPTPVSFLDIAHDKRMLFVFSDDHKLYLLKPTDKPMNEEIEPQPEGYPLIPN
jgi:hypothetical protein